MKTEILRGDPAGISRAGAVLRAGGLVAIPTETVYGLAADALDPAAVCKIFAAKGRPADNPLIVHIVAVDQWEPLVRSIPSDALRLAEAFWPGPLTIILEKSDIIPQETSGGLETVAVRCPSHPLARAVIQAAGRPLAAPSANPSGRPSPTRFSHVKTDLFGKVDALLDGGDCAVGVESTVVSLAGGTPRVLRPGGVTVEQLEAVLGRVEVDPAVSGAMAPGAKAASPGMKYKHYAPKAQVEILDGSPEQFADYINKKNPTGSGSGGLVALSFDDTLPLLKVPAVAFGPRYDGREQARRLFAALLRLDELGAERVFAQRPQTAGVGLAVYNRLARAAAFRVTRLDGPWVVGLVGPSGAGKSTVAAGLAKRGAAVVDCDALTRSPAVYNQACLTELCRAFGKSVAPGMVLDRRELARRAFQNEEGVKLLGEITFPHICRAVREEVERHSGPVLLDAPTLFQAGLDSLCARILAVTAPETVRVRRVAARDGLNAAELAARFAAQKPEGFYTARADFVIENGEDSDISGKLDQAARELGLDQKGGCG